MAIGISEELMTEAEAISDPCACTVQRPIIIPESSPPSTSPGTRTFPAPANTSQPTPAHVGSRHRFMPGRSVGTREQAEAAPDPSPDPSRSRRLVASSQPTGKPGQEVGRRARALTRWRWARAFLGAPTVARTTQREGVKERRQRGRGGWAGEFMAAVGRMGGQQAPTEPKRVVQRVNSEVSMWGQASNNNYQILCGCKDTMKHFLMAGRGTI
ncbi:hypothetical protein C2845_PM10G17160 [Panicum miliaceum]|uniref:Uncharacterized protein n=1 Tax=Panicum miliaceum TaxID=4540 RepID=A0A3L6P9X3_PANMI|nr:hypothetical protein C2845_PM10G17160 [Panicum miliaceum]